MQVKDYTEIEEKVTYTSYKALHLDCQQREFTGQAVKSKSDTLAVTYVKVADNRTTTLTVSYSSFAEFREAWGRLAQTGYEVIGLDSKMTVVYSKKVRN